MPHLARFAALLVSLALALGAAQARAESAHSESDLIAVESPHSVAETADRLAAVVKAAGATLFARIDHAAGAASIGAELPPTQVLIFGNPKIGTAPIQERRSAGLDLPLRVLIAEIDGRTVLLYRDPAAFAAAHALPADHPSVTTMTAALAKLTGAAAAD